MTDFSTPLARRIVAATEAVEKSSQFKRSLPQHPVNQRETPLFWTNSSGESAPAWAALEVSSVQKDGNRVSLTCVKPTGDAGAVIVFNGRSIIADGKHGIVQTGSVIRALFSDGTGTNGQGYQAADDNWKLERDGTDFTALGAIPDATDQMFIKSFERLSPLWAKGTSALTTSDQTVSGEIYQRFDGSSWGAPASTISITLHNVPVSTGGYLFEGSQDDYYLAMQLSGSHYQILIKQCPG